LIKTRGIVEGHTYRSEYLGLRIDLPSEWRIDDYSSSSGIGFLEEVPSYVHLREFLALFRDTGNVLGLHIELGDYWDTTEIEFINDFISRSSSDDATYVFDRNQAPVKIGNYNWYFYFRESNNEAVVNPVSINYVNIVDGLFRTIAISGTSLELIEESDILSFFSPYP
jgi:hypothetical protein